MSQSQTQPGTQQNYIPGTPCTGSGSTKESSLLGNLCYTYCLVEGPYGSCHFLSSSRRGHNWEEMSTTQVRAGVRPGAPIMVFRKLAHKPEIGTLSRESECPGAGLKWTGKTGHLAGRLHSQDTLRIAKIIPETNRRLPQHCAWSARQGLTGIPENTRKAVS